jgi:hypothetical protein
MIKKALLRGLEQRSVAKEELYDLDDQGLFTLLETRSAPLCSLGNKVRDGQLYITVAEFPYNEALHHDIMDITKRSQHERVLAEELSALFGIPILPEHLIIDIPESITFETGLYVQDEACYFQESSSVFKVETVDSFIRSLHTIRIFIDPVHKERIQQPLQGSALQKYDAKKCNPKLYELLHIHKKWL